MYSLRSIIPLLGLIFAASISAGAAPIEIKDGQKIAFLGDSITAMGASSPGGYAQLVVKGLAANGIKVTPVFAGVSGNTSKDMLARLSKAVLSQKPDWMTLSCGVNDVWHGARGVSLDDYKTNITAIVNQAQAAGIHVVILTATVIKEDVSNDLNQKLLPYNDFLRQLAKDKEYPLADLNADFQTKLKEIGHPGFSLTIDGVHMNPAGDEVMATGILSAFGLDKAQMDKARAAWTGIPDRWSVRLAYNGTDKKNGIRFTQPLTGEQFGALTKSSNGKAVRDVVRSLFEGDVKSLLKPQGEYDSVDAIFTAGKDKEVTAQIQAKVQQQVDDLIKQAASAPVK